MATSSLDDLKKVLLALPRMPKAIVDDTRHEKVLSYTSAFISQSSPELYQIMLSQWHILRVLQECTASDQDHRVSGVAMRILGVLLEHDPTRNGNGAVWHQLETSYTSILDYLIQSNKSDEALLRYSSWSALQHIVRYSKGALCLIQEMVSTQASERDRLNGLEFLWMVTAARSPQSLTFLKKSQLLHGITTLLTDDSRLVRARALDVLAILLDTASDPLALIVSRDDSAISSVQSSSTDAGQPVQAFVDYLLDHFVLPLLLKAHYLKAWHVAVGVLDAMTQPLCRSSNSQLRRSSVATILSTLLWILQAFQDTATTINSGTKIITIEGNQQCRLVQELNSKQYLHQIMRDAQKSKKRGNTRGGNGGSGGGDGGGSSEARVLPKTVVLSVLKSVQNVARLCPESVEHSSLALEGVLSILFNDVLCNDQRVFKTCLGTLPILLKAKVRDGQLLDQALFSKTMAVILDLIRRQEGSSTPLKLILEAVQEFFADPGLGRVLVQEAIGQQLAQRLQAKLYDMEWDVRDTVVEFIGDLFAEKESTQEEGLNEESTPTSTTSLLTQQQQQQQQPRHGVAWALKYNLLESVFLKLTDEDSYVRAASVHSFELAMRNRSGWSAMTDPTVRLEERLSAQLPHLIRDSEAFVRRAVLDAMICLVKEREAGSVLLVNGTDLFVDAKFMSRLALDDADWEVRVRACRFLAAVWDHCLLLNAQDDLDSRMAARIAKRAKGTVTSEALTSNWWFYDIRGDDILIEATRDEARMVRAQSIALVKMIKRQIEQATPPEELTAFLGGMAENQQQLSPSSASNHHEPSSLSRKRGQTDKEDGFHCASLTEEESSQHPHPHPHAAFYRALCALDFVRLDATASVEQLYEEVLNVERVEDVVMEESERPNDGNNVLDCY
ncbi:hypothetical protein BGZ73_000858 [Actinomortierella ambigua]|nr:hypothetical protein BGZ73_000858 [Actinomortierella ambigua]